VSTTFEESEFRPTKAAGGLLTKVAQLMRDVHRQDLIDVDTVLRDLTESALETLPPAQYAGVTIASRDGEVRTAASIGRYPALLDKIQERHRAGPCLSAAWEQQVVRIDDVAATHDRWSGFCRDVISETPIRSVMSFQLFADHHTMGALNFYAEQPGSFDDNATGIGVMLATHVAVAWNMVRRDMQFRSALASRDIIGQAKGMVMERFKIDAVQAFELLKRLSQSSNTPVVAIARQLVEAEQHGH
jgi:transcriptional regulator with GAF, ATPase, and Fis domain